jgi:Ca2+-binding RTX toxin-like protein
VEIAMAGIPATRVSTAQPSATAKMARSTYQDLFDASLSEYAAPAFSTSFDTGSPPFCSLMLPITMGFDAYRGVPTSAATTTSPTATKATSTALYLQEAGDTSLISVNDIHQGQIGDCFLLASIGEIALWHPSAIMNMIHANADGTETVTLHLAASGQLPTYGTTQFRSTAVTITNAFPSNGVNNGATQDVVNGVKEIWVQVLEKAIATLGGGYNYIANGDNPMIAMEELTGQATTYISSPASLTFSMLQGYMAAGDLIVMDTYSTGRLPYNLVNNHAYMFESVTLLNGTPMIQLGNPWGYNQPQLIPLSQLSSGIAEIDIGNFIDSNLITGGPGNDTVTLTALVTNASVDLGAGNDTLTLANGTNSATVANTETIIGGTGSDAITLATVANNASIDLGAGNDTLAFGSFTNSASVARVETLTGGSGNDTITLSSALTAAMSVNLGAGNNRLTLNGTTNTGTLSNVATLAGGSGNDAIITATALSNGSIDLGAGNDSLTFGNFTNAATVANVETITGGTGNDSVTLVSALAGGTSVDLGAGSNKLTLANGGNTGTVKNVATLVGGTGSDTVTLGGALVNGSVDLGSGSDTLNLANFTNRVSVANTETVHGGSGNDTIVLTGSVAATVIGGRGMNFVSGNSAADRFVFDQNSYGNLTKVLNFSASNGDKIALDTTGSNTLSANTYDLGGAGLIVNVDLADVANVTARLSTTLSNGGKGAFVYEHDTGELFYSSNGSFKAGGTMIGIVTTDGSKPWTFDARSFVQV